MKFEKTSMVPSGDIADDEFDTSSMPFFTLVGESSAYSDMRDLDGNSYTSDEFTLSDILPGLLYPVIPTNIRIEEN